MKTIRKPRSRFRKLRLQLLLLSCRPGIIALFSFPPDASLSIDRFFLVQADLQGTGYTLDM